MNAQSCLSILREIRDVAFATVDESNRPQVRIIDVMLVEESRLYFCTARGKDFYHQLMKNGAVAITGMNQKYQMIRMSGIAAKLANSPIWIDHIFEENPSMEHVYPGESRSILEAFCVDSGQIEFFDLGTTPIFRQTSTFGSYAQEAKGFWIGKSCTGCSACKEICPQQCIQSGSPYKIAEEHCLHCGHCFEACPSNSIVRREAYD